MEGRASANRGLALRKTVGLPELHDLHDLHDRPDVPDGPDGSNWAD